LFLLLPGFVFLCLPKTASVTCVYSSARDFHTTISEAFVFERVIKLIGEQKLVKQRLQKNVHGA